MLDEHTYWEHRWWEHIDWARLSSLLFLPRTLEYSRVKGVEEIKAIIEKQIIVWNRRGKKRMYFATMESNRKHFFYYLIRVDEKIDTTL